MLKKMVTWIALCLAIVAVPSLGAGDAGEEKGADGEGGFPVSAVCRGLFCHVIAPGERVRTLT